MSEHEAILRTLLREGSMLYPYRPSALKNRFQWAFGCCFPRMWTVAHPDDADRLAASVLLCSDTDAPVTAELRFLQPPAAEGDAPERTVALASCTVGALDPGSAAGTGRDVAVDFEPLRATASISATQVEHGVHRIDLAVRNHSRLPPAAAREQALPATLASTHFVVQATAGRFVSVQDPPPHLAELARACHGPPLWPFLVGRDDTTVVCSPIIVEDHPKIAPESPGDFFDATEIDEMLTLRVLTMTDAEAREAAEASPRVAELLARCRDLSPAARSRLLGAVTSTTRRPLATAPGPSTGDRVVLHPRVRADALDGLLRGRTATITGVEVDFEGRRYFTVVIDGDPGADLGRAGLPGHRFFFGEEEVQPL